MKELICEMCGSNNIIKQDGLFVCQMCGTKYSVEDAKKMMIEGTVDVSGSTVKIDNSGFVEKYLANARRAYEKKDWEETEKYYNLVEQNDPSNIEAIFYSAYAKACTTLIDADYYKKESAFGVLCRCVGILDDNYDPSEKEIVEKVGKDILGLYSTKFVFSQTKNGYGMIIKDDKAKTIDLFNNVGAEFVQSCINIAKTYHDIENQKYFYKIASSVADISCKHDYAYEIKKIAYPEVTEKMKLVTVVNDYSGLGKMTLFITIPGVFEKRLIPSGTSGFELMQGEYECILYCGLGDDPSKALKKKTKKLSIPENNKIEIKWALLSNGYKMVIS